MKNASFCKMNLSQLHSYKKEYEFHFTETQLKQIQGYYQKVAKREPAQEEVALLDRISALSPTPYEITPSEFFTNEPEIAKTYADIMQKRFELYGTSVQKLTLAEFFGIANAYLEHSGKEAEVDFRHVSFQNNRILPLKGQVGVSSSSTELSLESSEKKVQKGDRIFLVAPEASSAWSFEKRLKEVFSQALQDLPVKDNLKIENGGILPTLLHHSNGFSIDRDAFGKVGYPYSLSLLTNHYSEGYLLIISQKNIEILGDVLKKEGFYAELIGSFTDDANLHWLDSAGKRFSLHFPFLRSLLPMTPTQIKVSETMDTPISEISTDLYTEFHSKYLESNFSLSQIHLSNASVTAAFSKPESNPFLTSLQTVLSAALPLYFASPNPQSLRLAISLRFPEIFESAQGLGTAFSTILGIYRAQAELSLPALRLNLQFDSEISTPELTVYGILPENVLPETLQSTSDKVYCVSPALKENRMPNFEEIRALSREFSSIVYEGKIQSIKAFRNQAITTALREYSPAPYRVSLSEQAIATEEELHFGLLVESCDDLPFRQIGTVAENETIQGSIDLPRLEDCKIPHTSYEICILSNPDDFSAKSFAKDLSSIGYDVHLFTDTNEEKVSFCRTLLTANLLILTDEANLSKDKEVLFAISVMKKAGGAVWTCAEPNDLEKKIGAIRTEIPFSLSTFQSQAAILSESSEK